MQPPTHTHTLRSTAAIQKVIRQSPPLGVELPHLPTVQQWKNINQYWPGRPLRPVQESQHYLPLTTIPIVRGSPDVVGHASPRSDVSLVPGFPSRGGDVTRPRRCVEGLPSSGNTNTASGRLTKLTRHRNNMEHRRRRTSLIGLAGVRCTVPRDDPASFRGQGGDPHHRTSTAVTTKGHASNRQRTPAIAATVHTTR